MCKESQKTQSTTLPGYVTDLGKTLSSSATDLAGNPGTVPLQGTAGFSGDQTDAFQKLRDLISGAPQVGQEAIDLTRNYAADPAQKVSTERTVDENGKLGAISDYMNPNTDATLAPALRAIQEQADAQRKRIQAAGTSSGATRAGPFSDGQYNVAQGINDRNTSLAVGDTAHKAYSDAFNTAMTQRAADLNRFGSTDVTNANLAETATGRKLTGATGLESIASQDQNKQMTAISSLLAQGGMQQDQIQKIMSALFTQQTGTYQQPYQVLAALASALGSNKGTSDTTTTTTEPDNSGLGLLGAIGGGAAKGFAGSAAGSAALAALL